MSEALGGGLRCWSGGVCTINRLPAATDVGKTLANVFASAFVFACVCRLFASTSYPVHCLQRPAVCKRLFASFVCEALRARPPTLHILTRRTYPHQRAGVRAWLLRRPAARRRRWRPGAKILCVGDWGEARCRAGSVGFYSIESTLQLTFPVGLGGWL